MKTSQPDSEVHVNNYSSDDTRCRGVSTAQRTYYQYPGNVQRRRSDYAVITTAFVCTRKQKQITPSAGATTPVIAVDRLRTILRGTWWRTTAGCGGRDDNNIVTQDGDDVYVRARMVKFRSGLLHGAQ